MAVFRGSTNVITVTYMSCNLIISYALFKIIIYFQCTGTLDEEEITILNGTDEDVSHLTDRLLKRKEEAKLARKAKKSSGKEKASNGSADVVEAAGASTEVAEAAEANEEGDEAKTGDVDTDLVPKVKKSSKRSADKAENGKLKAKKMTISDDTTTSETYKKLFHSHNPARSKDKTAHWVTYNPYYN